MSSGIRLCAAVLVVSMAALQGSCVLLSMTRKDQPDSVEPVTGCGTVAKLPFKEGWYGTYFQEERIGYSHFKIVPAGNNFEIDTDSLIRLKTMKKIKEIRTADKTVIKPDLSLVSFNSSVAQDTKLLLIAARVEAGKLLANFESEGERIHREVPLTGPIFSSAATGLMPALKGLRNGASYKFKVFKPEKQDIVECTQEISQVQGRPGPHDAVWKITNTFPDAAVSSWHDRQGQCVLEKAMDGALIVMAEDEKAAQKFIDAGTPTKDVALDAVFVESDKAIDAPESLRVLKLRVSGVKRDLFPEDQRQKAVSQQTGSAEGVLLEIVKEEPTETGSTGKRAAAASAPEDLEATPQVQADNAEIMQAARKIAAVGDTPLEKVKKLVKWTSGTIRYSGKEAYSAYSELRAGEGECKAHAKLYAALARACKVRTRIVTGLVYVTKGGILNLNYGFAHHAWAESYVSGWIAVDPTKNQVPADVTHIKLGTGDALESDKTLLGAKGKAKIEVVETKSQSGTEK